MKLLLTKILLFRLALALTVNLSAQHLNRNTSLSINKNFELFYALYLSSGTDSMIMAKNYSGFPLVTQQDFKLKRNYYNTFSRYKNTPEVQFYYAIATQGFFFSAPFKALLRVDSNLNITDPCYFDQLPLPQQARESVVAFIDTLKAFRDLVGFNDFFAQNKPLYDTILRMNQKKLDLDQVVTSIENFFGWKLKGYHVMLSPMMWPGGVSLNYMKDCADSLKEIYVCIGPKSVEADHPLFGTNKEYKSTIVHEFIHPFIMHYCNKYREQIMQYASLYNKDEKTYRINGCPDWFSAVNEILTRTAEIIITNDGPPQQAAKAVKYQSEDLGFSSIPVLYSAFNKFYGAADRKNSDLNDVFLKILHSLNVEEYEE